MLDAESLIQIQRLRNKISVKFVEFFIEEGCEVLGELIRLLQTRPQPIGESCDVWDVVVFGEFWLVLNTRL